MYIWQERLWQSEDYHSDIVSSVVRDTLYPDLQKLEQTLVESGLDVMPTVKRYTLDDRLQVVLRWNQNGQCCKVCIQHHDEWCFLLETDLPDCVGEIESSCCLSFIEAVDNGTEFLQSWQATLTRISSVLIRSEGMLVA